MARAPNHYTPTVREFLGNVVRVLSGTTLSQAILIGGLPLLTRIYAPEAFTELAIVSAATAIATPLVTLRFDNAVLSARGRSEAEAATMLSFATLAGLSALLLLVVVAMLETGAAARIGLGPGVLLVTVLAIALQGSVYTLTQLSLFLKQFNLVGRSKVAMAVALVGCQAALAAVFPGGLGLTLGFAGGLLVAALYLAVANRGFLSGARRRAGRDRLAARLRRQRPFAIYTAPSNAINAAAFQSQPLAIIGLFGASVGAMYFLATRSVSLPGRLIGYAVSGAFWADAARLYAEEPEVLMQRQKATVGLLALIGLPGFLLLPFGDDVFALVFGGDWRLAGSFAGVIWVGAYMAFVGDCTGALIYYGKNLWMSLWEIGRLLLLGLCFTAAWYWQIGALATVWIISLAVAFSYAVLLGLNTLAIHLRVRQLRRARARR